MLGRPPATRTASPPTDQPPTVPPPSGLWSEWRAAMEPLRLVGAAPALWSAPSGSGLVVDLPGYLTPEASLAPLRRYLRFKGYNAQAWGLGINRGDPEALRHTFVAQLESIVAKAGMPAALVGWSLGGVVAREAARLRPDLVSRVIVFGSPLIGGPSYTITGPRFPAAVRARIEETQRTIDEEQPVQVPVTSIFSRYDAVVDWRASMDHYSAHTEHVEVSSTHTGLPLDPQVWMEITRSLADPHPTAQP